MFGIGKKKKKATAKPTPQTEDASSVKEAASPEESGNNATHPVSPSEHHKARVDHGVGPFDESDGGLTELLDPNEEGAGIADFGAYAFVAPVDAQLQIETSADGSLAVHILVGSGHITMDAYSAPKSGGQWRMVASELADGLRAQGAKVSIQDGPWGREVVGAAPNSVIRFIGADGPRWMLRTVVVSNAADAEQSAEIARTVFAHTVVRRGMNAMPARTPIPLVLPTEILEQVQAEQLRQQEAAKVAAEQARRRMSADRGEALQQFDGPES